MFGTRQCPIELSDSDGESDLDLDEVSGLDKFVSYAKYEGDVRPKQHDESRYVDNAAAFFDKPLEEGPFLVQRPDGRYRGVHVAKVTSLTPLGMISCMHRIYEGELEAVGTWSGMLYAFARHCSKKEGGKGAWFDHRQYCKDKKVQESAVQEFYTNPERETGICRLCDECLIDMSGEKIHGDDFIETFCCLSFDAWKEVERIYLGFWRNFEDAKEGVFELISSGHSVECFEKVIIRKADSKGKEKAF
jgi:hypothetical protein